MMFKDSKVGGSGAWGRTPSRCSGKTLPGAQGRPSLQVFRENSPRCSGKTLPLGVQGRPYPQVFREDPLPTRSLGKIPSEGQEVSVKSGQVLLHQVGYCVLSFPRDS